MNGRFILTDQGRLEYYLGVEISKLDENTLSLHQTAYVKKILYSFNMSECNSVKTPLPRNLNRTVQPAFETCYAPTVAHLIKVELHGVK
jgi:hypothetical protein